MPEAFILPAIRVPANFLHFCLLLFLLPSLFLGSHRMRRNMKLDHVNESKKKSAALRADLVIDRRYEQFFFFYFSSEK